MNPRRTSEFKSSFNPSCKQTRSRGRGIRLSSGALTNSHYRPRLVHNVGNGITSDDPACDLSSYPGQIGFSRSDYGNHLFSCGPSSPLAIPGPTGWSQFVFDIVVHDQKWPPAIFSGSEGVQSTRIGGDSVGITLYPLGGRYRGSVGFPTVPRSGGIATIEIGFSVGGFPLRFGAIPHWRIFRLGVSTRDFTQHLCLCLRVDGSPLIRGQRSFDRFVCQAKQIRSPVLGVSCAAPFSNLMNFSASTSRIAGAME
jgi:hypothetical protein